MAGILPPREKVFGLLVESISDKIITPSAVPQGSYIGSVLFLLFINDLPSVINHSKMLLYADDVKIDLSYNSLQQANLLQQDLCAPQDWCEDNDLDLNLTKCIVMSFSKFNSFTLNYFLHKSALVQVLPILQERIILLIIPYKKAAAENGIIAP